MGNETPNMDDIIFNLRFKSKEMEREAKRMEKEIKKEKKKIKKAIEKKQLQNARIFAENAIRKKSEMSNYYKLAARLDATSSRLKSAQKQKDVSRMMGKVVRGVDMSLKSMDLNKITNVMEKFEKQCEDLDVIDKVSNDAFKQSSSNLEGEDEVNDLLQSVADAHDLEIKGDLDDVLVQKNRLKSKEKEDEKDVDELSARLKKLTS